MKKVISAIICILLSVAVIGAWKYSLMRNNSKLTPYDNDRFWSNKTFCPPVYDMVLIGDSRVNNGLSPDHMAEIIGGIKILNFGYNGMALTRDMYEAAVNKISGSPYKIIVVGISPRMLLYGDKYNELYEENIRKGKMHYNAEKYIGFMLKWIYMISRPVMVNDFLESNDMEGRLVKEFHDNGWMSVDAQGFTGKEVDDMVAKALLEPRKKVQVLEVIIQEVEKYTAELKSKGYTIFMTRLPEHAGYKEFEDKEFGFNEREVRVRMEKAGAVWFQFDDSQYNTYDGAHLPLKDAVRFSVDLANRIKIYCKSNNLAGASVRNDGEPAGL